MTQLTSRQIRVARKIGGVVDELAFRNAAAGRAIDAMRVQRRRLREDIARIDQRVHDQRLEALARLGPDAKTTLQSLRQQQATLREQDADCERQVAETQRKRDLINEVVGPWSALLDAVLAYARASRASLGIPFGSDVSPSFRPDVVVSERPA
ncbi:MAG: hypothetical protein WD793_02260 [Steroidobacteraceae bacterium]